MRVVHPSTEGGADPPVVDPEPFDLPGRRSAAALCLHGLTGTPYEVRPLGEALSASGIRAVGPVLPGHNATPQRLAAVSHAEWLDAARAGLTALREGVDRVFAVGLSMGGLLALALAAEQPIDGVVVVGTPLRLRHPVAALIPLLKWLRPLAPKPAGSDICDAAARARHPSYDVMPLHSVHELQRLQRRVRAGLGRVTAPILIAHGAHDRTADPRDVEEIRAGVSSTVCEVLVLPSSGHVVPVDVDGPALASATTEFLLRLC